jgi:hypothetical protein
MPRLAIDYSKTVIYKLVCKDLTIKDCYVGHTTDFTKRKYSHKSACTNSNGKKYNCKVYKTIRENGGWDNWSMVLIETYDCDNRQEAERRERYWYEELNPQLNTIRPHVSEEELKEETKQRGKQYREINRDELKQKCKEYQEKNKDKLKEYRKEHYEQNKDEIKQQLKENYEKNKDERIQKAMERYEKNKDKRKQQMRENYKRNKMKIMP